MHKRAYGVGGQKCFSAGPTKAPGGPNGPPVYMLKYALQTGAGGGRGKKKHMYFSTREFIKYNTSQNKNQSDRFVENKKKK